jgi:hypothetical protein
MCPDRQIFSVYYDRELPSPWKETMEAHLAGCPECRARLKEIEEYSAALQIEPVYRTGFSPEEAEKRVWNALAGLSRSGSAVKPEIRRVRHIWGRSVTIPLPIAAAAAALFVLAFTLVLANRPETAAPAPDMVISADMDLDMRGITPVSGISDVLQYLGQDNGGNDFIIIRLPETKHFMSTGEPAIIRAADYSRRMEKQ